MSSLMDFLLENPVENITEEVIVSQRLKGKPFKISAMSNAEFSEYQKAATRIQKGKKVSFDSKLFNETLVINHTLTPDFKNADAIKKAGCMTAAQLLNKVLLAGEIAELAERISGLSGFDQSMDEMVDEAKN